MFLGHFGLGFAAKKLSSQPSLDTTFLAAQFIDLLWPFFLLSGVEKVAIDPGNTEFTPLDFVSYPYSHSLVAVLIWAVLFALIYYLVRKNIKAAIMLGLLVTSHWVLDFLTHRPDLPLSFSEAEKVGLGLWNNKMLTIIIELIVFFGGVFLYTKATKATNRKGVYTLWGLILFFLVIYFMNAFGDPPPNAESLGYVGLAQWIFIAWGYWIDKHRTSKTGAMLKSCAY